MTTTSQDNMATIVEDKDREERIRTEVSKTPRYDVSIFDTPFAKLPDPKRVWIGEPGSELEGLGMIGLHMSSFTPASSLSR